MHQRSFAAQQVTNSIQGLFHTSVYIRYFLYETNKYSCLSASCPNSPVHSIQFPSPETCRTVLFLARTMHGPIHSQISFDFPVLHFTKDEFIFAALNEAQVPAAHITSPYPRICQRSAPGHAPCTRRTFSSSCSPKDPPIASCWPLPQSDHRHSRIGSLFPFRPILCGGSHPVRSVHQ